jgi:hypothetical protein
MRASTSLLAVLSVPGGVQAQCERADDPLQILDFHLEMDPAGWRLTLLDSAFDDDGSGATERPAVFRCGDEAPVPCRVRRKRSPALPSEGDPVKVSLKIDFNDAAPGGDWHGHRKLSLENGAGGVILSEGLAWILRRRAGVIAGAASWVRLHVNGAYLGVFVRVEQMDRRFLRRHLGEDGGFLYKNGVSQTRPGEIDPHPAELCYPPFDSACAPPPGFAGLARLCDLRQLLAMASVNAFLSNWDSLFGNGNNYWHYNSGGTRLHFPWDLDKSLSRDPRSHPGADPLDLLPEVEAHDVLFRDPGIRDRCQRDLRRLVDDPFRPEVLDALIEDLLAAVGPAIESDPLNDLEGGPEGEARRIRAWIRDRSLFLSRRLPSLAPHAVVINEVLASNATAGADEAGEADDWVELLNRSAEPASLAGLSLSDDPARPAKWPCPDRVLAPGESVVIWCDGDPGQGPLHAGFKLDADGEGIGLYSLEGEAASVLEFIPFRPQETDRSLGRFPDGSPGLRPLGCPTPASPNREVCANAAPFLRGDADGDGVPNLTDVVRILQALFLGGALECLDSADVDDDGIRDITDAIRLLGSLFLGAEAPPAPYPSCGPDPTPDALGCGAAPACAE